MIGGKSTGLVLAEKPSIGIAPTRLYDQSRYANHGTHTGITMVQLPSELWVNGSAGFDKITISDAASIQFPMSFAYMIWLNITDFTIRNELFVKAGSGNYSFVETNGIPKVVVKSGAAEKTTDAGSALTTSTWQLFTYVFNATTGHGFIYYDAIEKANTNLGVNSLDTGAGDLTIGNLATGTRPIVGSYGLVKLFNYPLTPAQIRAIYQKERHWFGV